MGLLNVVTGIFVDSAVTTRTEDEAGPGCGLLQCRHVAMLSEVVDSYREDLQRTSDEVQRSSEFSGV